MVRSDRSIGGFAGQVEGAKITKKIRLLKSEGVQFDSNGSVVAACVFSFDI